MINSYKYKSFITVLFSVFIIIVLIFIGTFREVGLDADSENYFYAFKYFDGFFNSDFIQKEPFFWLILTLNKYSFNSINGVFFIYITLELTLLYFAIKKLSLSPLLSLLIYISLYYIIFGLTQIRVGIVIGLFLLMIPNIYNRNYYSYYFKVIIAILFHYSMLILIPFYIMKGKELNKFFYLILPIIAFFLFLLLNSYYELFLENARILPEFVSLKLIRAIKDSQDSGSYSLINFKYILNITIYYFILFNLNKMIKISRYSIILFKIFAWSLFIYVSLSFFPSIAFRISNFLEVVLIILFANTMFLFKEKLFIQIGLLMYLMLVLIQNLFIKQTLNF